MVWWQCYLIVLDQTDVFSKCINIPRVVYLYTREDQTTTITIYVKWSGHDRNDEHPNVSTGPPVSRMSIPMSCPFRMSCS